MKNTMNKKKALILLATLLTGVFAITINPFAFAQHEEAPHYHDVYWTVPSYDTIYGLIFDKSYAGETYFKALLATSADELYNKIPLCPVVFEVDANKSSKDAITGVEVIMPQDDANNALFNLKEGKVTQDEEGDLVAIDWITQVVEVDSRGWVRVFRFELKPETEEDLYGIATWSSYPKLYFRLYFSEGEEECNYRFTLWTHDRGINGPKEAHRHYLWLMMDKTRPRVEVEPAANGTVVNGILAPCGNHYFILNVTAADDVLSSTGDPHDSGIKNATITIANATSPTSVYYQYVNGSINFMPGKTWKLHENHTSASEVWNLRSGNYTLKVNVWDGVGNKKTVAIHFTYVQPPSPLTISPGQGYAAPTTRIKDSITGLVESTPETYKFKTLGTLVTVEGLAFGSNAAVTVRVYIPTYHDYHATYGTYKVLVNKTKTKTDGTFTATFVFPKAPAGIYNVSAQSAVMECAVKFTVLPEIIFNPDNVVGPALIDVKATGFTAENMTRYSWFFILPDALQGVNTQVDRWWYIDGNGTLASYLNYYTEDCEPPQSANTTLNWPFMEPGTYTVEIKHIDGDYWDGNTKTWIHKPCFAGSNKITVANTLGLLVDIEDDTAYIRTEVDKLEVKLDELKPVITRIDGNVVEIETTLGTVTTTLDTIAPKIDTIKGDVATIKTSVGDDLTGKVVSINGTVATIETEVGIIKASVETLPNLTTPIYIAALLSLIAAIAAIACTILVYRKIA